MDNNSSIYNYIFMFFDGMPKLTFAGIVEILIFSYIIFKFIVWIKATNSYHLLRGIFIIIAFVFISYVFNFTVILWILSRASGIIVIAIIVIFQSDIRQAIEQLGRHQWFKRYFSVVKNSQFKNDKEVSEICKCTFAMAKVKTGALIVLKQNDSLKHIIDTGIRINGILSSQLMINIFEKNTPLHDGAVIVDNDVIVAATCYLPLSENYSISKDLGTRHRAALGISEISDSLTIVVSEETGRVSVAYDGMLKQIDDEKLLANELYQIIYKNEQEEDDTNVISIINGWFNKNENNRK